jgi:hypothetical protein
MNLNKKLGGGAGGGEYGIKIVSGRGRTDFNKNIHTHTHSIQF